MTESLENVYRRRFDDVEAAHKHVLWQVIGRYLQRFLPYTTKSRFPKGPLVVRAYLAIPPAWYLLGKQTLYVAHRPQR